MLFELLAFGLGMQELLPVFLTSVAVAAAAWGAMALAEFAMLTGKPDDSPDRERIRKSFRRAKPIVMGLSLIFTCLIGASCVTASVAATGAL